MWESITGLRALCDPVASFLKRSNCCPTSFLYRRFRQIIADRKATSAIYLSSTKIEIWTIFTLWGHETFIQNPKNQWVLIVLTSVDGRAHFGQ